MHDSKKPDINEYEPLFGSWAVKKPYLGKGGFGEVYKIHREAMGMTQYAAVKRISLSKSLLRLQPKQYERVQGEIQTMLDLQGASHIVLIHEFTDVDWANGNGKDFLIRMELLTSLEKQDSISIDEVVKMGIHICRALVLCHERKLVHRDIKPGNILVSKFGEYKLSDFGIARVIDDDSTKTSIGTPGFKAPEVAS